MMNTMIGNIENMRSHDSRRRVVIGKGLDKRFLGIVTRA